MEIAGLEPANLLRAREALSQLSYIPKYVTREKTEKPNVHHQERWQAASLLGPVGLSGLEPETSVLSGPRSNHLS